MMRRLLVTLAVLVCTGCAASTVLTDYLDPQSTTRLASLSTETGVVASVTTKDEPILPPLSGGRVLGRSPNSILVEIPKSAVSDLGKVKGLTHAAVWGSSEIAGKMDAGLRTQLLALVEKESYAERIPMLATFDAGEDNLEARLKGAGADVRTVAGRVITVDADFAGTMNILAMDGLTSLAKPRQLKTLRDH